MKACPQCGNTYTDDSLRYCLSDGSVLSALPEEQPAISHAGPETRKVKTGRSTAFKIVFGLIAVSVLVGMMLAAAVAVYFVVLRPQQQQMASIDNSPPPPSSPVPPATNRDAATDDEPANLERELAELQRMLEEGANTDTADGEEPFDIGMTTAEVDSPNDGFLALRSIPSHEFGERLARIPHGTPINVISCANVYVTIGERRGRWCLVNWEDQAGWVFDAWLKYPPEKN